MHRTVRALVVVLLLGGLGLAPPAQAADDGRRLLVGTGSLVDGAGALKSEIPVIVDAGARFSPDGTMLAHPLIDCQDGGCSEFDGYVRLQHSDGSTSRTAGIPYLDIEAVAWSPDQTKLAVIGRSYEPGDQDVRVYLVPVAGGPATKVFDDTLTIRMFEFGGISWRSTDNTLAVIATEFHEDEVGNYSAYLFDSDQVWTMPAQFNATPTRFTASPADDCGGCTWYQGFRWPTWSPDGSTLAVLSTTSEDDPGFVGTLGAGDLEADPVADAITDRPVAWSTDGDELAVGVPDLDDDFYNDTRVYDATTGATLATVKGLPEQFVDRLPCPEGVCEVWENVFEAPKPFMNLRGRAKAGKAIASGEMGRVDEVSTVAVTLFKKARSGAPWKKVDTAQVTAYEGMFKKSFPRPRAVQCKVKGVYVGSDGQRATDSDSFPC